MVYTWADFVYAVSRKILPTSFRSKLNFKIKKPNPFRNRMAPAPPNHEGDYLRHISGVEEIASFLQDNKFADIEIIRSEGGSAPQHFKVTSRLPNIP